MSLIFKTVKHPELLVDLAFSFIGFSAVKYGTMQAYTLRSNGMVCHTSNGSISTLIKGGNIHALVVANNRTDSNAHEADIFEALRCKLPVLTETEYRAILRADKQGKHLLQKLRQMRNKPAKDFQPKTAQQLNAVITKRSLGAFQPIV